MLKVWNTDYFESFCSCSAKTICFSHLYSTRSNPGVALTLRGTYHFTKRYLSFFSTCHNCFRPPSLLVEGLLSTGPTPSIFTDSQELGTLSRYHNSCLFAWMFGCPSPLKRLHDFIIYLLRINVCRTQEGPAM